MTANTLRRWRVLAILIARVFLATTLLLKILDWNSHVTFYAELVFSLDLLLGAALAVGWLMRYAAATVFLGTLAATALTPHFHAVPLPAYPGTTVAVLIASGILVCFSHQTGKFDFAFVDENNESSSEHSCALPEGLKDVDGGVTTRLEDGHFRGLSRRRCVVTIHDRAGGVQNTGREVWYARDNR